MIENIVACRIQRRDGLREVAVELADGGAAPNSGKPHCLHLTADEKFVSPQARHFVEDMLTSQKEVNSKW
jgi:hypothetical protein